MRITGLDRSLLVFLTVADFNAWNGDLGTGSNDSHGTQNNTGTHNDTPGTQNDTPTRTTPRHPVRWRGCSHARISPSR